MKFIIIFCLVIISSVNSNRRPEKGIIDHLFQSSRYDHRILPEVYKYRPEDLVDNEMIFDYRNDESSGRIEVKRHILSNTTAVIDSIDFYLRAIEDICSVTQTLKVQLTLRQRWRDFDLGFNQNNGRLDYINLSPEIDIWRPDLFVSNEIESNRHNMLVPNTLTRLYPNGSVLYSTRITLKTLCPMNFKLFPFDRQTCSLQFASYAHTTDDLIFKWKEIDAVQVSRNVKNKYIFNMKLNGVLTKHCTAKTTTGEYSCLRADLLFERNPDYFMCRWFLTSIFSVSLVWLSFWLSPKQSKPKICILLVSTIILCCIGKDIKQNKPMLDYNTLADQWITICWIFVITGYIQLGFVHYFSQKEENKSTDKEDVGNEKTIADNKIEILKQKWMQKSRLNKFDTISIILFPIAFILIQLIFVSAVLLKNSN